MLLVLHYSYNCVNQANDDATGLFCSVAALVSTPMPFMSMLVHLSGLPSALVKLE